MRALGGRYRSSALAQEKTGEAYVESKLYGGHTRGDFEHAEVAVFIGKNRGSPRASRAHAWCSASFHAIQSVAWS